MAVLWIVLLLAGTCAARPHLMGSSADSLSFLLLGDWGKGGSTGAYGMSSTIETNASNKTRNDNSDKDKKTFNQLAVAAAMGSYAASAQPSFVVALGDNFYSNGVSSSTDVLWSYLWKDVYLPHAALAVPWYPVFGNHDYGGGAAYVRAQLQRTQEHLDDDIWQFEASNYTKTFTIPGLQHATVQIVFIDTTTLSPSVNKCCNEYGGISREVQAERIADQVSRITAVLEEAQANPPTWLLVVGHYPVYSAGSNGDNAELQMYLLPLLVKYKVHAYICGHDHISEHLQAQGIEFFVAGAGSMTDGLESTSKAQLIWSGVEYSAFGAVTATASTLKVEFIDANGTNRYAYTLTSPYRHSSNSNSNSSSSSNGDDGKHIVLAPLIICCTLAFLSVAGVMFVVFFKDASSARGSLQTSDSETEVNRAQELWKNLIDCIVNSSDRVKMIAQAGLENSLQRAEEGRASIGAYFNTYMIVQTTATSSPSRPRRHHRRKNSKVSFSSSDLVFDLEEKMDDTSDVPIAAEKAPALPPRPAGVHSGGDIVYSTMRGAASSRTPSQVVGHVKNTTVVSGHRRSHTSTI